jgi:hypothetical protein
MLDCYELNTTTTCLGGPVISEYMATLHWLKLFFFPRELRHRDGVLATSTRYGGIIDV